MPKELKENRVPIMMEDSLLKMLDDYRFARRIGSRGAAVRLILTETMKKEMPVSAGE